MGLSSSCQILETVSSGLLFTPKTKYGIIDVVKLLDDFLFVEKRFQSCQSNLSSCLQLCELLGIPVAMEKTSDLPLQMLIFLGILLDTIKMIAELPDDNLHAYTEQVELALDKNNVLLRELKGIIGRLQFATSVVTVGKAFLRRMHDLTIGISKPYYRL